MKLLTSSQIQAWDKITLKNQQISSWELMERAVKVLFEAMLPKLITFSDTITLCCGYGNNGGDGLGLARYLYQNGYSIQVICVGDSNRSTPEYNENLKRLSDFPIPIFHNPEIDDLPASLPLCIDALLGIGLSRPIEESSIFAKLIKYINRCAKVVWSIDIPSGIQAEAEFYSENLSIQADQTFTFQLPKIAFYYKEIAQKAGKIEVLDISLDKAYYHTVESNYALLDENWAKETFIERSTFSHKGNYGHVLLLGGWGNKTGAGILAAQGAYRSGCGLLTCASEGIHQTAWNIALPESMFLPTETIRLEGWKEHFLSAYSSIGLGHGWGMGELQKEILQQLFLFSTQPLIIDADALSLWAKYFPDQFPKQTTCILTPHVKEYERWRKQSFLNTKERIKDALQIAQTHHIIIVLKDSITAVLCPNGQTYFCASGNPGMAKGGSGDVLTGILTALAAQSYTLEQAATLAVWLHAQAGSLAAKQYSQTAVLPTNLIQMLPTVFKQLERTKD